MPANSPTAPADLPVGGILLVEEYTALGIAIASALRKFAPLHGIRVVRSFAEALAVAAEMRPDLLVLDLDPPPGAEIAFLQKLQKQYPETRVLVLAPGISRDLRTERGSAGAIQFIEKPFDLAEFGAAVQALLGRWAVPPSAGLRGTLRDLHVVDVMQLKCLTLSTAIVRIANPQGETGEIHFRHGQIWHAAAGVLTGVPALEEIVGWPRGKLCEAELPLDAPKTIERPWATLLLQVVRQVAKNGRQNSLGPATGRPAQARKAGKKILVIDDTEMLLIFVADVLGTADQTFQIITASTGGEGLNLAATMRPDLVLLDYSLTDMNGDEVCRGLLADEVTARIPVLMMSGHLTEMATTAQKFRNVVATLAKPFLSGALINAVEKVLGAGPLPKNPRTSLVQSVAPPAERLPNEGYLRPSVGIKDGAAFEPAISAEGPSSDSSIVTPAKFATVPPAGLGVPQSDMTSVAASAEGRTQVSVTLGFEVISIQLTSSFRLDTLKLCLAVAAVAVRMTERDATAGMALETGFRLGTVGLSADGQADTIRLIPTRQMPQLVVANSSFAVGGLSVQLDNAHPNVELTAPERTTMHVRLTAQFEILMVELSDSFEVVAVMLKSSSRMVRVSNGEGSAGGQFEMKQAQINPLAQLETLFVRAMP